MSAGDRPPMAEGPASDLQGVGDVGERRARGARRKLRQSRRAGVEGGGAPRGEAQQARGFAALGRRRPAAPPRESTWALVPPTPRLFTPARRGVPRGGPRRQRRVDVERALVEGARRIRRVEVQAGRNLPVLERQRHLDERRDAGGGVEVADVGLHRADGRTTAGAGLGAEGLGQRGHFDRIADRRARAVGLDVADRRCRDAGDRQRLGDALRLSVEARRQVAHLAPAVVVHRRAHAAAHKRRRRRRRRPRPGAGRPRRRRCRRSCRARRDRTPGSGRRARGSRPRGRRSRAGAATRW